MESQDDRDIAAAPEPQFEYDHEQWEDQSLPVILRAFREAYGHTIFKAAEDLKIRATYLQHLEEGQYDSLPGHTYAAGYVRTYATYLGLPVDEMVDRFKEETKGTKIAAAGASKVGGAGTDSSAKGKSNAKGMGIVAILAAFVVLAAAVAAWYFLMGPGAGDRLPNDTPTIAFSNDDANGTVVDPSVTPPLGAEFDNNVGDGLDDPAANPTVLASPNTVDVAIPTAVANPNEVVPGPNADQFGAILNDWSGVSEASLSTSDTDISNIDAIQIMPAPPLPKPNFISLLSGEGGDSRIVLHAKRLTHVQIYAASGEVLISQIMRPDSKLSVPNLQGLRLLKSGGNDLDIYVDGQIVPTEPESPFSVALALDTFLR